MDFLNMIPEVIYMLKFEVSTLGMLTPYLLTAPLSLLAFRQMLIIKMVVHDSRTAVCKGTLFTRESFIANTIGALRGM